MKKTPFLLFPAGKDYLWGGTRLKTELGKDLPMNPLAETWECSTHPDGTSVVASGFHKGELLSEVLKKHPEYLGSHPMQLGLPKGQLPILIKLIDAKADLSVQVHPNDDFAKEHENGSLGKTEMWYVLDAKEDTSLIYGFWHQMDKEVIRENLEKGTIETYLQKVPVHRDDVFYIEPGTVHAIGAGALIAEIQESSNITYRMYDYNRIDKDGKKRELHVEKSLQVANLNASSKPRQPMRVYRYKPGCATELLCRCQYFQVERFLINQTESNQAVYLKTEDTSFQVLLCTEGSCEISFESDTLFVKAGQCIFIPAGSETLGLHGKAQFLKVNC